MSSENKKLRIFLKKMLEQFDYPTQEYLKNNLGKINYNDNALFETIYSYLSLIPYSKDRYRWFANFVIDVYGTNGNILEVGGGYFPALASHIDRVQSETGKGTITVYDPKLFPGKLGNIILIKENFDKTVAIQDYDLVIGMRPCGATYDIISQALAAIKPFAIVQCDCSNDGDYYNDAVLNLPINMRLEKMYLPCSYGVRGPLIYSQNRK